MKWSTIQNLSQWRDAPKTAGIYLIGLYTGQPTLPNTPAPIEDRFLGGSFPQDFAMKYVGSARTDTTLRVRLKDHHERSSNKNIREYLRTHGYDSLAYIYVSCEGPAADFNAAAMEQMFLTGIRITWWNIRRHETKRLTNATHTEFVEPMTDEERNFLEWYDPHDG